MLSINCQLFHNSPLLHVRDVTVRKNDDLPSHRQKLARIVLEPSLKARSNCARPLARLPSERSGNDTQIVLLGSIATQKYVAPLLDIFGKRLVLPCDFVGRGDMSRGGLLPRCSCDSTRLEYVAVANAARRGPRPQSRGTCCTTCLSTRGGRQATRGW
jgi:hypothetical protein